MQGSSDAVLDGSNSMKLLQNNCNLTGPQVAGFQLVTLLCIVSRGREIPAAQHLACQKCLCQSTPCQALPGQHLCVLTCARQSVYSLTTAQCLLLQCRYASRAQPALVVFGLEDPLLEHFTPFKPKYYFAFEQTANYPSCHPQLPTQFKSNMP